MTNRNPWVDTATSTDVRERAQIPGEDWREWMPTIVPTPSTVPELVDLPAGCPFAGRCTFTQANCYTDQPPARTLQAPSTAAPASLASWRQPHIVRCLHDEALRNE